MNKFLMACRVFWQKANTITRIVRDLWRMSDAALALAAHHVERVSWHQEEA